MPSRSAPRRGARRLTLIVATYVALAVLMTWPLVPRLTSHLGAPEGPGDPYLNLWILGWDLRTVMERPGALLDGRIFDANIFHPADGTLAYSDHLLPQALLMLPLYAATNDVVVCYNVLLLLSIVFSGLSMHACARQLGAPAAGAFVAGIAWAFWPYRIAHLIHLQLQALYFLPLAVLLLARLLAGVRIREAVALGVVSALQVASSLYYGLFTAVTLATIALAAGLGVGRWRQPRFLGRLGLAAVIGGLLAAPVVWPYWRMQHDAGFARTIDEASRHAALASSYLQVPEANRLYGGTRLLTARDRDGMVRAGRRDGVEHALFPGVTLLALGALGAWRTRRAATGPLTASLVVLVVIGFVLSLGPDGLRGIYSELHRHVPGFQAIRAPARFGVLVTLGLALLASRGVGALAGAGAGWRALPAVLLLVEYASVPLPLTPRPAKTTPTGEWLARDEAPGAVVYLPLTNDGRNTVAMVDSLQHGRPIVNGYSGQRPAFFPALVDTFSVFPSVEALWTLKELDVRFVVAPEPIAEALDAGARARGLLPLEETPLVERRRLAGATIYEVAWTPAHEESLMPPSLPLPPPPGPSPFATGERAVYDVVWIGGPMGIPAGTVVLEVLEPTAPVSRYRLAATARTAEWVAPFFEARDRYVTAADRRLLPLWHERSQRHGRRSVDRRYEFDADTGTVTLQASGAGPPLTLPMPSGTRDALTTFYYIRTLDLARLEGLVLSVNDGGRTRRLQFRVQGPEPVRVGGAERTAIRIDPLITERVPRRAPVTARVWLSDDARRIPMVVEVAAGFGRVRIELRSYEP